MANEANEQAAAVEKIGVGVTIDAAELERMKAVSHVDANGTAVLACARMGVEAAMIAARKAGAA